MDKENQANDNNAQLEGEDVAATLDEFFDVEEDSDQPAEAEGDQEEAKPAEEDDSEEEPKDEEPDQEETDKVEEELIEVVANGETLKVKLDELKKGYSRELDYRRKTTELAEKRREVESLLDVERNNFASSLAEYQNIIKTLDNVFYTPDELKKLKEDDPSLYAEAIERKQKMSEAFGKMESARRKAEEENAKKQSKAYQEFIEEQKIILKEKLPELSDSKYAREFSSKISDYLTGMNFTKEDIAGVTDARMIMILDKAIKYDELQAKRNAKKPESVKKKAPITGRKEALAAKPNQQNTEEEKRSAVEKLYKQSYSRELGAEVLSKFL